MISVLPNDLIRHIVLFCDSSTQLRLSETTRTTKLISDLARKKLSVAIPLDLRRWRTDQIRNIRASILGDLLKRFSHITHLSFSRRPEKLNEFFVDIIDPFIELLKAHYPTHLRHVILHEIEARTSLWQSAQAAQLNKKYFDAFGHPQLSSLKMIASPDSGFVITDDMINSVLTKSTGLTSFTFDGGRMDQNLNIYLSHCPKLETVRLNRTGTITRTTIEQLGSCLNLRELSIDDAWNGVSKLEQFLCTNHKLKLKVLNLKRTNCLATDEALHLSTQYLTDLEFFSRKKYHTVPNQISDRGLVQLANNCKKLTTLIFDFENITDKGLTDFAASAPQLRKLSMSEMPRITHKGLLGLAQHCRQLEALELSYFRNLNLTVLLVLAENCKSLTFLNILRCNCKGLTVKDLRTFITSCKSLKYLRISDGLFDDCSFESLIKEFFPPRPNPLRFEDI